MTAKTHYLLFMSPDARNGVGHVVSKHDTHEEACGALDTCQRSVQARTPYAWPAPLIVSCDCDLNLATPHYGHSLATCAVTRAAVCACAEGGGVPMGDADFEATMRALELFNIGPKGGK